MLQLDPVPYTAIVEDEKPEASAECPVCEGYWALYAAMYHKPCPWCYERWPLATCAYFGVKPDPMEGGE